jgi:chloramphenicol O-acetyltransferase type A
MRTIDFSNWNRRRHFETFIQFDHPHFSLCANVDITHYAAWTKQQGISRTIAIAHLLAAAANQVAELRLRIRSQAGSLIVVEHEVVHPSFVVLTPAELFSFCTVPFSADLDEFAGTAGTCIRTAQQDPRLEDEPGQDDLLFMTSIPWVSFTSITHPIRLNPVDSTPRIAWGKFFQEGEHLHMPLSIQAHHSLVDGVHVGKFFDEVQHRLFQ